LVLTGVKWPAMHDFRMNYKQYLVTIFLSFSLGMAPFCFAAVPTTNDANDYYNVGMHYLANKKYEKGIRVLSKGISRHPKSAKLYNLRANMYHLINELHNAKKDFEKAYKLDPDNDGYRFDVDFINDLIKSKE
jgi:tetratricopeptide (TPR) repeat protein